VEWVSCLRNNFPTFEKVSFLAIFVLIAQPSCPFDFRRTLGGDILRRARQLRANMRRAKLANLMVKALALCVIRGWSIRVIVRHSSDICTTATHRILRVLGSSAGHSRRSLPPAMIFFDATKRCGTPTMGCCTSSPYSKRIYHAPDDPEEENVPLK